MSARHHLWTPTLHSQTSYQLGCWHCSGYNVRSPDRMITSLPSVVWHALREGKIKFHFSSFKWLARPVRLKIYLILRIFHINTSLKSPSRYWTRAEFVKSELNITKVMGVYADHIFIHSILRNKRRIFLSRINQSVESGHHGLASVYKAGLKVHIQPSARLVEAEIFPLLIDSIIWSVHTPNSQPSTLSSNNYWTTSTTTTTAAAVTSYLEQTMSINAALTIYFVFKLNLENWFKAQDP